MWFKIEILPDTTKRHWCSYTETMCEIIAIGHQEHLEYIRGYPARVVRIDRAGNRLA